MFATYKKRSGTSDCGKDYEWLLCAFYSLKLVVDEQVDHFELSSNNPFFGDFDDICLRVRYVDNSVSVFLLQSKHSEQQATLTLNSLVAKKGDFALSKYRASFSNMLTLPNFIFILFTNRVAKFKDDIVVKFDSRKLLLKHDSCVAGGVLDTNPAAKCSVFKFKADYDLDFYNKFYIYASQQNVFNLKQSISNLLQSVVNSDIYSTFIQFMRETCLGNFRLRKSDVIAKIAELVFGPLIRPLDGEKRNPNTDLIKTAIMRADLTLIENNWDVAKIWGISKEIDVKSVSIAALKFGLTTKGIKGIDELSPEKLAVVLWYLDQVPLVVQSDPSKQVQIHSALKLLEKTKNRRRVVLVGQIDLDDLIGWKMFANLADLTVSDDLRKRMATALRCSVQGKDPVALEELGAYDSALTRFFSVDKLLQMALGAFIVGEDPEPLPPAYIPRRFHKLLFDYDVIDAVDEKFVLSCAGQLDTVQARFRKRVMKIDCNQKVSDHYKHYMYGCDGEFSKDEMEDHFKDTKSIFHHFRVNSGTSLELLHSTNCNLDQIDYWDVFNQMSKHLKVSTSHLFEENQLDRHVHTRLRIIAATTGGGKTSLMTSIKKNSPPNCYVLKLKLKDCSNFFDSFTDHDKVWNFLVEFVTKNNDSFEKGILQNFAKEKVMVLWDGFDELPEKFRNFFVKCVKWLLKSGVTQWITTKNHCKAYLERAFCVFTLAMAPLDQFEQRCYVQRRLGLRNPEDVEEFFRNVNIVDNTEYLGIPLQLYILTDIFSENKDSVKDILTLTDLCRHFIDGKYSHFLNKTNYDVSPLDDLIEDYKKHKLQHYKMAAVKIYLPDLYQTLNTHDGTDFAQQIGKGDILGLILNSAQNSVEFEHNIFGQYFCASWLAEHPHHVGTFLFDPANDNIKFMFDLILAGKNEIFISLLYKKYQFDDLGIVKDAAGRSPLHVICTYGKQHPLVSTEKSTAYYDGSKEEEAGLNLDDEEDLKNAISYLKTKCDVLEKDKLFDWTPYQYADQSLCLGVINSLAGPLETVLPTLQNYQHLPTVLYYSTKYNYTNLFSAFGHVITYFEYDKGHSLLHVSSEFGREDFLRCFLQSDDFRRMINRSDWKRWTPIHFASSSGHLEILKCLKDNGGTLRVSDPSPLSLATRGRHQLVVNFLGGCDVTLNEFYQQNYLSQSLPAAISRGYIEIVQFLVTSGAKLYGLGKGSMNALQLALVEGQLAIAEFLLDKGLDLDEVDTSGMNCYHHAAINNQKDVVDFLMKQNAKFQVLDKRKRSPLHYAAQNGSHQVAEALVRNKIEIESKDANGSTALHLAAQYGQTTLVQLLIAAGCDVNPKDRYGRTPAHYAALNGAADALGVLLSRGGSRECEDLLYKRRPLHYAAWNCHEDCVRTLIENGAEINPLCQFGYTPLHLGAAEGGFEVCQLLVAAGGAILAKNANGQCALDLAWSYAISVLMLEQCERPLHVAVEKNKFEVIPQLLALGHDINGTDDYGVTPLHLAVGKVEALGVIRGLLENGARVETKDYDGYTALHYVLQSPFLRRGYVEELLKADLDNVTINARTSKGLTPLHVICQSGLHFNQSRYEIIYLASVRLLLARGARVDVVDEDGFTPLHFAARSGFLEIFQLLVESGSRLDDVTKHGRTVLHMAATQNCLPMVTYLLRHGACVTAVDDVGDTPLDDALKAEHPKVYLAMLGDDVSKTTLASTNQNRRNVLHMAAKQNFADLVDLCLANQVDVDTEDSYGNTPIDDAFFAGNFDIFQLLLDRLPGYDVNKWNKKHKMHLMHFAVARAKEHVVQLLLDRGARLDLGDEGGNTPIHYAVDKYKAILEMLLDHDAAAIDKANDLGQTPLHVAVALKMDFAINKLVAKGARVDLKDNAGNVPFDLFLHQDNITYVDLLLRPLADFDVNKPTAKDRRTLLHHAAFNGDLDLARWLIARGAAVNVKDTAGYTPFHSACRHEAMVRLFLDHFGSTIDATATTNDGKTVLSLASRLPADLVKTLIEMGAQFEDTNTPEETLLLYALSWENTELIAFLLDKCASVDVATSWGNTPLHVAASSGDLRLVKALLARGANINSVTNDKATPVTNAADKGHLAVLDALLDRDVRREVVNQTYDRGRTLLHSAAAEGRRALAALLVRRGARLDLCDEDGKTAAEVAQEAGEQEIYAYLTGMMVDVD